MTFHHVFIYTQSAFCTRSAVCSLQPAFCTERPDDHQNGMYFLEKNNDIVTEKPSLGVAINIAINKQACLFVCMYVDMYMYVCILLLMQFQASDGTHHFILLQLCFIWPRTITLIK